MTVVALVADACSGSRDLLLLGMIGKSQRTSNRCILKTLESRKDFS